MNLNTEQKGNLSANLKDHLRATGQSLSEFSRASKIGPNTVTKLVRPEKIGQLQQGTVKALERALGKPVEQLVGQRVNGAGRAAADVLAHSITTKKLTLILMADGTEIAVVAGTRVTITGPSSLRVFG